MSTLGMTQSYMLLYGQGNMCQLFYFPLVEVNWPKYLMSHFVKLNWITLIYYDLRYSFDQIILLYLQYIIIMIFFLNDPGNISFEI